MNVNLRQKIERNIVEQVVRSAIEAGYELSVDDGEEITLKRSRDRAAVMKAMFTADEDTLWVHRPEDNDPTDDGHWRHGFGWVYFVYGNDGHDVICDHTTNLEDLLKRASALADKYETLFA